jgi:hypothetical protein
MIIARFTLGPDDLETARTMSVDMQSPTLLLVTLETADDVLFRAPFGSIDAAFRCVQEMLPDEIEQFSADTQATLAEGANGHAIQSDEDTQRQRFDAFDSRGRLVRVSVPK